MAVLPAISKLILRNLKAAPQWGWIALVWGACITTAFSQTINYSLPEKTSTKNYDYKILGKNSEGIIIYKYNRFESVMEAYAPNMTRRWQKRIQLAERSGTIQYITLNQNKFFIIYSYDKNYSTYLVGQRFSAGLDAETNPIQLDSVYHEKWSAEKDWYINTSEDKSKFFIYYLPPGGNKSDNQKIVGTLADNQFRVMWHQVISLPSGNTELWDQMLDNTGKLLLVLANTENYKVNHLVKQFTYCTVSGGEATPVYSTPSDKNFCSSIIKIDNVNRQLVLAGFYTEDGSRNCSGYCLLKYDLDSAAEKLSSFTAFDNELMKKVLTAEDVSINNFQLSDLVLQFDGGVVLLAENSFSATQTVEVPNYYSPTFPSTHVYTYYHFDDVMALSLDASGNKKWDNMLRKKQTSEGDGGRFSSYCLLKGRDALSIIFNEDISDQSNLLHYKLTADGESERNSFYGSRQKNIFLSPRYAKQVSLYEMVIPSEYRGFLQFVKIDF